MSSIKIRLPNDVEYEQPIGLFINNEYIEASGNEFEVVDPASVASQTVYHLLTI